ncbi:MAG: hypothetical protein ABDH21_03560 [bacterium]
MSYTPLRVKRVSIEQNKIVLIVSFFETKDELNDIIQKQYTFDISQLIFVFLGYIKNIEQKKEEYSRVSRILKKIVSLGLYDQEKEKSYSFREDIFLDLVFFNENPIFFRIDLTTFNYKDFLKDESTFSSFSNMRKFISCLVDLFGKQKTDDIIHSFLSSNSLSKIQYFSSVYEFEDYVMNKIKNITKGFSEMYDQDSDS